VNSINISDNMHLIKYIFKNLLLKKIVFLLILLTSCKNDKNFQNFASSCNTACEINISYFKTKDLKLRTIKGKYTICLEEGFEKDSLKLFLNGQLIKQGIFTTDPSTGLAGCFDFTIDKNYTSLVLYIENTTKNECLEFAIDPRFKIIRINYFDYTDDSEYKDISKNWQIIYDYELPIYE